jgi:hypothetical protein
MGDAFRQTERQSLPTKLEACRPPEVSKHTGMAQVLDSLRHLPLHMPLANLGRQAPEANQQGRSLSRQIGELS